MINCAAWLRLIQQHVGTKICCPWPGKRFISCNHSRSILKNKQKIASNIIQKISQRTIGDECCKEDDAPLKRKPPKPSRPRWKWRFGYTIILGSLFGTVLWAVYELGRPEQDQFGRSIEDELSTMPLIQQYVQRMWRSLHYYQKMLQEPLSTKLLPDVVQHPYIQPRYTLVLEMRDVLVHPDWTYQTGWRFKKRPGVDHFLRQVTNHFEIIVYTAEQGMTAFPILDALDPNGYIRYRLVRGATQLLDGHHIKNLNRLNRNLRRVIVVDWDRRAVPLHPDNIFAISRWVGNDDDVQLFDLAAFLGLIAEHKMDDVREVLHYYRQFEDPIEQFKENQRKLLEMKQEKPDTEPNCQLK
ncbi:mitochondrial import inner membrane translocase subunit TIM50-A [Drosophila virilis]|uniref:Mitochondrial import inner membrane translocase subunit TIM50 n=1 Tax=Drosophila virilis TaxID=7244 RepID=B4LSA8_DROVI|nr:mitochondrial import inner membrane translocase subunit TIM50-C [Drosophila virilis]EDW63716.1 uncharacterized protein Dvir_GJ11495 [Drosophila virilis]